MYIIASQQYNTKKWKTSGDKSAVGLFNVYRNNYFFKIFWLSLSYFSCPYSHEVKIVIFSDCELCM